LFENPGNNVAKRWERPLVKQEVALSLEELERLQQIVIENSRFTEMGLRKKQACWRTRASRSTYSRSYFGKKDIEPLMNGLLAAMQDPLMMPF
jgi:hypothetical protein